MQSVWTRLGARRAVYACALWAWCCGAACAQELSSELRFSMSDVQAEAPAPEEAWRARPWRAQIEPMIWWAGMYGDIRSPGSGSKTALASIDLDSSGLTPSLEAFIRDDGRTVRIGGFIFGQSGSAPAKEDFQLGTLSVSQGQAVTSSVDFSSFELMYGVRAGELVFPSDRPDRGVSIGVDVYGGVRAYDMKFEVESGGQSVRDDGFWMDLVLGARAETEITDEFSFDIAMDLGAFAMGDRSSSSVNVVTGFQWRPDERMGVQIGYRFMAANYEDGENDERFSFSGSIAGLYLSAVLRF